MPLLFKPKIPTHQLAPPGSVRALDQCDVESLAERAPNWQRDGVTLWIQAKIQHLQLVRVLLTYEARESWLIIDYGIQLVSCQRS